MSKYKLRTEAQKARRRELAAQKRAAAAKTAKTPPKACKSCTEKCAKAKKAEKPAPKKAEKVHLLRPKQIVIQLKGDAIPADSIQIYEKFMNVCVSVIGKELIALLGAFDDAITAKFSERAGKKACADTDCKKCGKSCTKEERLLRSIYDLRPDQPTKLIDDAIAFARAKKAAKKSAKK